MFKSNVEQNKRKFYIFFYGRYDVECPVKIRSEVWCKMFSNREVHMRVCVCVCVGGGGGSCMLALVPSNTQHHTNTVVLRV